MLLCVLCYMLMRPATAQLPCNAELTGSVVCTSLNEELAFASVHIYELNKTYAANERGRFYASGICAGTYRVQVIYTGHQPLDTLLHISGSMHVVLNLPPEQKALQEVVVEEHRVKKQEVETLQKTELRGAGLDKVRGATLGESLKSITGVNSVQTGPGISKPMIHGLYGSRVLILNNGVRLEGQNWGADHAPEVDPFIATRLSVIKGAASIRYGMEALGGVVLVDPKEMPAGKCLRGEVNLVGASNGRAGTASAYVEGAFDRRLSGLSWRLQGTLRRAGNFSAPDYYLTNTALQEQDYSAAVSYTRKSYGGEVFYSRFVSDIDIYAGSHVGNVNDLLSVFNSPRPIVASQFYYDIRRGYQSVDHQLLKARSFYNFQRAGKLTYTFARQENRRSEFGEDLNYNQAIVNANIPDAYFKLTTHTSDLVFEHRPVLNLSGSIGASFITQGNVYEGLDYRALIPNYRNYSGGLFILEKWSRKKLTLEGGLRYDYKWMRTYTLDFTTLQAHSSDFDWSNVSGTLGATWRFNRHVSLNTSLGTGWRPPASIELFAAGIHQSAASFELGDTTLKSERSYNAQSYLNVSSDRWQVEIGGYYSIISNFIYLDPLSAPIVTIAGTFPAYRYRQANVTFTGVDASVSYKIVKHVALQSKAALVYAYNHSINDYLVYVPASRFENGIAFSTDSIGKLKQVYAEASVLSVAQQTRVPANSDYVPPPQGYSLLNAGLGFSVPLGGQLVAISFSVNNVLNTSYRDYLNRLRYYANDLGRNFTLRIKIPFSIITQ